MKINKILSFTYALLLTGTVASCSGNRQSAPLLKGHIEGANDSMELLYSYSYSGDIMETAYEEFTPDSLGNFVFPHALPDSINETDVTIYVNNTPFGAHLENGKTAEVKITIDPRTREINAEYLGDNVAISEFYGEYQTAFDIMKYFSLDENDTTTAEQYIVLLDSEYDRVKPYAEKISDSKKRKFYTDLAQKKYMWQKARILMDVAEKKHVSVTEFPEYTEIISQIDPNNEIDGLTGLCNMWITANSKNPDFNTRTTDDYIDELNIIDKGITYTPNRRRSFNLVANSFLVFTKPSPADAQKYIEAFSEKAADFPDLVEKYQNVAQTITDQLQPGDPLPYDPTLEAPDGSTIKLSELFGKVLYIDMWATWCVPCCKEIPHLEKLADRFKDNDKIQFVSISIDSDKDAWLKKIENDKPSWPQYLLPEEENQKFSQVMGISSIPRFLIIGSDGKFVSTDAERPSNSDIDEILNNAITH